MKRYMPRHASKKVMRRNLWLSVYILRVGVCSYRSIGKWLIIGLSINRQMIYHRAIDQSANDWSSGYRSIGKWLIIGLSINQFVFSGSIWSIRKNLELDLILFIPRSSRKKNLIFNPRAKRLHTSGETTSYFGRNDFIHRAKRLHTSGETTSYFGRNDFILRAKRLSVRAKRLRANRTSGETTCFHKNHWRKCWRNCHCACSRK